VNVPKRVWNNDTGYQYVYDDGWETEMLKIIWNSLNMSLDIESYNKGEYSTRPPAIYVGGYKKSYLLWKPSRKNLHGIASQYIQHGTRRVP